jgi:hypothetical protein
MACTLFIKEYDTALPRPSGVVAGKWAEQILPGGAVFFLQSITPWYSNQMDRFSETFRSLGIPKYQHMLHVFSLIWTPKIKT